MEINFGNSNNNNKKGGGIVGGLLLLLIGTILLWWNEGNNVRNIKTISQMEKEVIEIASEQVLPENDGKLVATNGKFVVEDEPLNDEEFNVAIKTARLKRVVEMYQWEEKEETDDNGHRQYSYSQTWSENELALTEYTGQTHKNPSSMPYKSKEFLANNVKVGAYSLSNDQIKYLATEAAYDVPREIAMVGYSIQGNYLTNSSNVEKPQIGDIRISWKYNDWIEASVLAVTAGNSFKDFVSETDVHINRVDKGILSSKELIQNQENENNMLKWILRGIGALLILFGYLSITGPISRLSSKVPILGNVVGGILGVISFLLAIIHSLLVIIIAWFRYRPALCIALVVVIVVAIVLIMVLSKKKKQE
ncbi:MAG: TMEM43 family protein [Clostridia bacterium]|nr:TMEM43 family protein [Clostridia bacterium]